MLRQNCASKQSSALLGYSFRHVLMRKQRSPDKIVAHTHNMTDALESCESCLSIQTRTEVNLGFFMLNTLMQH